MSTPKEIFLELLRPDGQPERQLPGPSPSTRTVSPSARM